MWEEHEGVERPGKLVDSMGWHMATPKQSGLNLITYGGQWSKKEDGLCRSVQLTQGKGAKSKFF